MRERGSLFLARDPYGIKPLYYADDGWTFRFASQVKALLAGGAISREPEPAGQVGFYLWGSVPEPFTTYREIRALPAGSTLMVDRGGVREPRRYHSIAAGLWRGAEAGPQPVSADARGEGRDPRRRCSTACGMHLVADVPVGAFLSAGIDSGALVGLMRDAGQADIQTVTLAFDEFRGDAADEAPLAEEVARVYGTRHTTRLVTRGGVQGGPAAHSRGHGPAVSIDGINTWFVSKAARELGLKVAVSGSRRRRAVRRLSLVPRYPALGCSLRAALARAAARQGRTHGHAPAGRQPRPQPEGGRHAGARRQLCRAPICCGAACSCPGS